MKELGQEDKLGKERFIEIVKKIISDCNVKLDIDDDKQNSIISEMFRFCDEDSSGNVDWTELLGGLSLLTKDNENETIKGLFDIFDENSN